MNRSWEKEKWRANTKEIVKENAALSGSCSNGFAPCQEQMNWEAADGNSLLQMEAENKLEDTIIDLLRE